MKPNPDHTMSAVDALAATLRTLGKQAFSTESTPVATFAARCEAWAQHVTRGTAIEGVTEQATDTTRRAWRELIQFLNARRRDEVAYVDRNVTQVRTVMLDLVNGFRRALADTQISSGIELQLAALEHALADGQIDEVRALVPRIRDAMAARQKSLSERLKSLGQSLRVMREDLAETKRDAETDPLTKVYNRGAFSRAFERTIRLATASGEPLTLILVDIDHFKWVNDTYGHQAGDIVLCRVADAIVRSFPRSDDFVARYGGEEFAILLRDVDPATADVLANRVLDRIRELAIPLEHRAITVTASAGHTQLRTDETAQSFFERADSALYTAKNAGRDRVVGG